MFKLCTAAALGVALIGSASAGVNLEYGQEYEEAYLQACGRDNAAQTCTCSMNALEAKVGFQRFADEVDRHGENFLEESNLAVMANDFLAVCEAKLHAAE